MYEELHPEIQEYWVKFSKAWEDMITNGVGYTEFKSHNNELSMFSDTDIEFMFEQGARDLANIASKIEHAVHDLAKTGKRLDELKSTERRLQSIQDTILRFKERREALEGGQHKSLGCCGN